MAEETPGNAGASTSSPPDGGTSPNSGVADTPASSPGSTASPSPSSSPASSTGSGEAASGEAFDFGSMFAEPPEIPLAAPAVVAPTPTPTPQAPPVPPPAAPVEAPPAAAKPTEPTQAPAAPQAPGLDTFDPASLSQHLAANEDAAVQFTAENMFKLTPEEIEALETNMAEAVPRLMAKAFVKSQLNALSQLSRLVPAMIQRQTEMLKRNGENETKFYARWPDIKSEKHGDMVRKYAAVYRQMHPQTTLEQMIEDLGPMVMMAARVVPQVGGVPSAQPANPVSRPALANGRSPPPPPFAPAGAGATNSSRAPELNPIEVMFQDQG